MHSVGATVILPVAGPTTEHYPYVFSILAILILFVLGGVFYAHATQIWMVIIARFVIGLGKSYGGVMLHSYWGEMTTRLDNIRKGKNKKPLKNILYILYLFVMNGTSFGECM